MPPKDSWVLRIPRSDDPQGFVLVNVTPSGKASLDLQLIATEGENPYVGAIKHSRLKDLRSKNFQGTDQELEQSLTTVLRQFADNTVAASTPGLETTASIRGSGGEGQQIVITLRKRIDSITQRIASITLDQDDDQTIELFDWTGLMVCKASALGEQISSLADKLQAAEDTIAKLNARLEELVAARRDHENRLMTNFVRVLNEKKLKIRNQQRLLAGAKLDASQMPSDEEPPLEHEKTIPRRNKRKAAKDPVEPASTDSEFETMDVDRAPRKQAEPEDETEDGDTEDGRETPQPLEAEEETETDDEGPGISTPPETNESAEKDEGETMDTGGRPKLVKPATPPPRRELPFARARGSAAANRQPDETRQDETAGETDDDEL